MLNTGMRLEPKEKWNMKAVRATFLGSAEDQRKDLEEVERQRQKIQTPVPDDPLVRELRSFGFGTQSSDIDDDELVEDLRSKGFGTPVLDSLVREEKKKEESN